jgi:hypothetical protein
MNCDSALCFAAGGMLILDRSPSSAHKIWLTFLPQAQEMNVPTSTVVFLFLFLSGRRRPRLAITPRRRGFAG